jgi:hypothetical protein
MARSPRWRRISVDRRIAILVVVDTIVLLAGVLLVGRTLSQIDGDLGHSKRFTLAPTEALPEAVEAVTPVIAALRTSTGTLARAQVDGLRQRLGGLAEFRYLSREIARLHGGTLLAKQTGANDVALVLQLPC